MRDNNSPALRGYTSRVLIAAGIAIIVYFLILFIYKIPHILLLIFSSVLVAVFLDGLAGILNKFVKISRGWSILIITILLLLIVITAGTLLGAPIVDQFSKLGLRLPEAFDDLITSLKKNDLGNALLQNFPTARDAAPSGKTAVNMVSGIFSSLAETLSDVIIVFLLGIYFASDPALYIDNIIMLLPQHKRKRAYEVTERIGHALRYWLLGQVIVMVSISILTGLGLWIIGMPFAFSLGLLTGLFSFVPYLGAVISFFPVALLALVESYSLALYAGVVYTILHTIEGYVLTPIIQEHVVSIPPALLIAAQILMYVLFGAVGVIVATPLAIVVVIIIQMVYIEDVLKDEVKILG